MTARAHGWLWGLMLALLSASAPAWAQHLGWYYGQRLDPSEWQYVDALVVQPDHVNARQIRQLKAHSVRVLAYVSLGEMSRDQAAKLKAQAHLSSNEAWNSVRVDTRDQMVRSQLLGAVQDAIARGFDGVFLDTVDSYLAAETSALRAELEAATARLIEQIREQIGAERLLWINRGFELIERVGDRIDGMVVESLFAGYDPAKDAYVAVSEQDRQWLLAQIDRVRGRGVAVAAIDYLPENRMDEARDLAERIASLGIQPWITDGHLTRRGVSQRVPVSTKILGIYDTDTGHDDVDLSALHQYAAVPIEYLGYRFDYHYINDPLPEDSWSGRYAGVVVWLSNLNKSTPERLDALCRWLKERNDEGLRVVMMGSVPDHPACHGMMGVRPATAPLRPPVEIVTSEHGFEGRARAQMVGNELLALDDGQASVWIALRDSEGHAYPQVVVTDRGGFALDPYIFEWVPNLMDKEGGQGILEYWIFDPFRFFRRALALKRLPVIDVTTENGRRILTAHLDGDGFVSRAELPGTPLAAEVVLKEVLRRYPVPHTISVIEAEVAPHGAYPKMSREAERIARVIYRLPFVEAASHTFSHPFVWRYMEGRRDIRENPYGWNLKIPGYRLSLKREIEGSVSYINRALLPKGKQVRVFLWSGDAVPGDQALAMTERLGLLNMNGGHTRLLPPLMTSLTNVSPVGRPRPTGVQIYAPVMNENVYTNEWTGPYWGYRDVVQTFRLLEAPRRLKPIGIYYHFYSGSKLAALNALHTVYQWALKQNPAPMYASDYIRRARAVYDADWFEDRQGQLCVRSRYPVRTLRTDQSVWLSGDAVLGWSDRGKQDRYVHVLAGENQTRCFALKTSRPDGPYLRSSSLVFEQGRLHRDGKRFQLAFDALKGLKTAELVMVAETCRIQGVGRSFSVRKVRQPEKRRVTFRISGEGYRIRGGRIVCQ